MKGIILVSGQEWSQARLSPVPLALQHLMDRTVTEVRKPFYGSVWLSTEQLEVLVLADDLVMLAEVEEALQHKFKELNDKLNEWGTKANWQKTRVMRIGSKQEVCMSKLMVREWNK